jgi:lipoyl(octanoyl) transferase
MALISVLQLGTIDYATGLRLQQLLVEMRKEGRIGDVLLLLEHNPVITLGRNAKAANVLVPPEKLAERGVEVFACDRGGDVTFHGPGQLVGYPIFDLRGFTSVDGKRKTMGAIEYVRGLEEVLIRTCIDFGINAQRISGLTGVWTSTSPLNPAQPPGPDPGFWAVERKRGREESAKIAAIGVHISRSVSSHGFALNVNTDLNYFDLIIPCGIATKPVTAMARELGKAIPLGKVAQSIALNFGSVFKAQVQWLEKLEALEEKTGVPMRPPSEFRHLHKEQDTHWS